MKSRTLSARRQRGFTLVEMSITMAAAGLLFAAVTTGQELIDQAKATKLLNDVKSVEAQIQQFAQLKGRMPGDCDADGIVDYAADATSRLDTANTTRSDAYSYSVLLPTIPADAAVAALESDACTLVSEADTPVTTNTTNANVWINDLKLAGVIGDSIPNRTFAKLVNEDFMFLGSVTDEGGESADGADYNAIVIHNVPQWMARRLATAINGQDARADRSRVRLLNRGTTDGTYDERWQTLQAGTADSAAMRDGMVTVAYFFDRVPESKMETDAL
ncbi:type II secretion system protein [Hydrogenophaga sp.]|uniref:type II secretion system protein n=1 Tax=Hydrogenophaga sp. TaxID=1904254 RepID=UPI003F6AFF42